jgi:hypothetical protein
VALFAVAAVVCDIFVANIFSWASSKICGEIYILYVLFAHFVVSYRQCHNVNWPDQNFQLHYKLHTFIVCLLSLFYSCTILLIEPFRVKNKLHMYVPKFFKFAQKLNVEEIYDASALRWICPTIRKLTQRPFKNLE